MIFIEVFEKIKRGMSYKAKNLHKVGLENLGIRCIRNMIHDGCLKKKE